MQVSFLSIQLLIDPQGLFYNEANLGDFFSLMFCNTWGMHIQITGNLYTCNGLKVRTNFHTIQMVLHGTKEIVGKVTDLNCLYNHQNLFLTIIWRVITVDIDWTIMVIYD